MFWSASTALPIGVEISPHAVRLLQFRRVNNGLLIAAAAHADLPPSSLPDAQDSSIVDALKKLLASGSFNTPRCVTTIAPTLLQSRSLRLPQMPDSELAQAIGWEVRDRFSFDPADGQFAFFRAGEVRRGTEIKDEVLLFAAAGDTLRRHITCVQSAGLEVEAIDIHPTALHRAVMRTQSVRPGALSAILDVSPAGAQLILAVDDRLMFYKHIELTTRALDDAVSAKLGVPATEAAQIRRDAAQTPDAASADIPDHLQRAVTDAMRPVLEELARELDMCFRYFVVTFRGQRPDFIRVTGPEASCSRTLEFLSTTLSVKFEPSQPLAGIPNLAAHLRPDSAAEWAVAAGLALYSSQQFAEVAA